MMIQKFQYDDPKYAIMNANIQLFGHCVDCDTGHQICFLYSFTVGSLGVYPECTITIGDNMNNKGA